MFRIINSEEWDRLCEENRRLEDCTEQEDRKKLMDDIMEAITDYDIHVREYTWRETARKILARGITCEPVEREPVVRQWDAQIDSLVPDEKKAATPHYSNQFRWHLFAPETKWTYVRPHEEYCGPYFFKAE